MSTAVVEVAERTASRKTGLLLLVSVIPLAYGLWFGLAHLKATWDDAAITAAFARTWAQAGHIALTPVSQTVEGFSSVLWFWLLSVPYFFTHNPDAGLLWMKALAGIFFAASIGLTYCIAARELRSQAHGIAAALLFAFCTTPLRETQNGMEMNLAAFLVLLLFRALRAESPRILYCWLLATLLLLARFESPFLLFLLLCGFLCAGRNRRTLIEIALLTLGTLAVIELWRHHLFGEWMPNSVYAKCHAPYRDWSTPKKFLLTRVWALVEVLTVLPVPIFAAIFLHRRAKIHPAIWFLAAGCFLFGAIFGHNTGPFGRMVEPMIPFLLIGVVSLCSTPATLTMLVCLQAFTWSAQLMALPFGNVSIAKIEQLGLAADSLRGNLHKESLTIMVPDIGGSALCCEHLRIVDAGMLADPELARNGWGDFGKRFREAKPDAVWTEPPWSTEAHIFKDGLLSDYTPEQIKGARLYVRNDLIPH